MDLSTKISQELPFLRRYARALSGSRDAGDKLAVLTLQEILADRSIFDTEIETRLALFKTFHQIFLTADNALSTETSELAAKAQIHLSKLTAKTREVLLLRTIEEFSLAEIEVVTGLGADEAEALLEAAQTEMSNSAKGEVLIIEDEVVISLDLKMIAERMGHSVCGIARTRNEAVKLGRETKPDLVLIDIQLADNSSGIDAAKDLLEIVGDVPMIYITAFPELLLTGVQDEPVFVITKPYTDPQIASAISQAMFFSSIETLLD